MEKTDLEVLKKARQLISEKENWIKGMTINKKGCMCALGAIQKAIQPNVSYYFAPTIETQMRVSRITEEMVFPETWSSLFAYNDRSGTTHEDVLKVFDDTIEEMKKPYLQKMWEKLKGYWS